MWCIRAVNFASLFPFAACRTRSNALSASFRLGVRDAFCWLGFPLASPLPSIPSAADCSTLFGDFAGVGSEEARLRACLRPPPKLLVQFSRKQLSRRLRPSEMPKMELIQRG